MLASASASALSPIELAQAQRILDAYPIELAELRASDKQRRFQADFFSRREPVTGRRLDVFAALGGNRSGKSIVCGRMCFAKFLRDVARDGAWFWCIGPTLERSISGQQKDLWQALPRWMFGASSRGVHQWNGLPQHWDEKIGFGAHRKIVLPTQDGGKCLVEFRSSDQDPTTFEQAKLDGIWVDEQLPEEIYDRVVARLIDRDGFLLYSDIPEQWWQYERLANAKPEAGVRYQHFEMADNAANLPSGAIERARAKWTCDHARMRIGGEFVTLEGIVYRQYKDVPVGQGGNLIQRFNPPAEWPRWRAIDYGSSAPTACAWLTMAPTERVYVYREYYASGLSVPRNAGAILDMSRGETYRQTFFDPHWVDPPPVVYSASKSIAEQYAECGITGTGWPYVQVMGEHAMVERVKKRLEEQQLVVFEDCLNTRREFKSWKHKCDKNGKPIAGDAYEKGNNHLLDAIKGFVGTNPVFTAPVVRVQGR